MKLKILLFGCLLRSLLVEAQNPTQKTSIFVALQDSLIHIETNIYTGVLNDQERTQANEEFIHGLVEVLKQPHSFDFPFDSLQGVSIVTPPDKKFRIFTWHFPYSNGTYRFYGAIQMNNKKLELIPLIDYTENIPSPQDSTLTHKQWFGAKYYEIVPLFDGKQTYYALLGWKGNNLKTTKRIIDVLYFWSKIPMFGKAIFSDKKKNKRVIFEHNQQASMMLKAIPEKNMILFDHLVPPNKAAEGMYELYGPDLTYDAYKISKGTLRYSINLDMRNQDDADQLFLDPRIQYNGQTEASKLEEEDIKYVPD